MPISVREPLLKTRGLKAGYGKISVLEDVDFEVGAGEVVALLGPNGAGKSTLLSAMSGLITPTAGSVEFAGKAITDFVPRKSAKVGLVHVVEGHRVFSHLSVWDNLLLAGYDVDRRERNTRIEEALAYFPEIAAKRADRGGSLSGGQQQMLTVAQGLVRRPRLLMLDEPSAGLSPVLVDRVLAVVSELKARGTSVLLVEQLIEKALRVSDRVYALAQGRIVLNAPTSEPDLPHKLERAYFGQEVPTLLHEA